MLLSTNGLYVIHVEDQHSDGEVVHFFIGPLSEGDAVTEAQRIRSAAEFEGDRFTRIEELYGP